MKYSEINLKEDIKKALNELGFNLMTKIQEESYEHILNGKDVVGMSSTGSGKTAAFMIPTLERINVEEKNGYLKINILKHTKEVDTLISNMNKLFEELELKYPKNIKIN